MRSYVELNLLLRHKDIYSPTERRLALGFDPDVPASVIRKGKIPGEYLFSPGTHHITELHTERTLPRGRFVRASTPHAIGWPKGSCPLSVEDELVLNCIHGAKHFWERLMLTARRNASVRGFKVGCHTRASLLSRWCAELRFGRIWQAGDSAEQAM